MRNFTKPILILLFTHLIFSMKAQSVTIAQGDWTNPSTWAGGVIPTDANSAIINHAVVVDGEAVCKSLEIAASGSLMCNTSILTIGSNVNGGNATLQVDGALSMSGSCKLILRGSAAFGANSSWTMDAGYLEIDGNNGSELTSVLDGTALLDVSSAGTKNITGGTICFADPHCMPANYVVKGNISFGGTNTVQVGRTDMDGLPLALNSNSAFGFDDNVIFTDLIVTYINNPLHFDAYVIFGINTAVMGNVVMSGGRIISNASSKFMGNIDCTDGTIKGYLVCDGLTTLVGAGNLSDATLDLTANGQLKIKNNLIVKDLILNNSVELADDYVTLTVTGDITGTGKVVLTNMETRLKRKIAANTVANFPIATTFDNYTPVKIAATSAATSWEVGVYDPSLFPKSSPANTGNLNLEWDINPILKGTQADITVQWDEADEAVGFNRGKSALHHWNGTSWDKITTSANPSKAGTTYSITRTGWSNFSPFAVFSQASLPVELISFTGKTQQGKALLSWVTGSEKNNDGFDVERSMDGENFEKIGFVKSTGNRQITQYYNFLDYNLTQNAYYRLKQVDTDGSFNYSKIITLTSDGGKGKTTISVYPNPVSDALNVKTAVSETSQLEIVDVMGRVVYMQNVESGNYQIPTTDLVKGIYIVRLTNKNDMTIQKIIKN
jgi:Secretion system C-terminal sorting domain